MSKSTVKTEIQWHSFKNCSKAFKRYLHTIKIITIYGVKQFDLCYEFK